MKISTLFFSLFAIALIAIGGQAAAENSPPTQAGATESAPNVFPKSSPERKAQFAKERRAIAKIKPVDINNASKASLMKLKWIDAATADKLIANRPYLSKAQLVEKGVIGDGPYGALKHQIIAGTPSKKDMEKYEAEHKRAK